jgi:hypothetical protein
MGPYETAAQGSQANPQPPQSLTDDGVRIVTRLDQMLGRLFKMGNQLHGSRLCDAGAKAEVRPEPNIRRLVDDAHALIHQCESELDHIESRL